MHPGRNGSALAIRRGLTAATFALTVVALVGCGDDRPQAAAELAQPAPVASAVVAKPRVDVEGARAQLASLGLADVRFEAPDPAASDARDASLGPAPKAIAESPLRVRRDSPRSLLDGALQALVQEDVAALARLSQAREQLNEDDASDARRRFLAPAGRAYWGRIAQAVREGAFDVDEDAQSAVVSVEVGGAAGSYRVRMRKESDGWYLDG